MKNAAKLILFAASLTAGSAAYGQTTLKADIPFAFRIPGGVAPAGQYRVIVDQSSSGRIVHLVNLANQHSTVSLAYDIRNDVTSQTRLEPRMVFSCGRGLCELSQVWGSTRGFGVPVQKARRDGELLTSVPVHETRNGGN